MNEIYWVITLIISFVGVLLFYKYFGKTGLFIWLVLATIISNIQTVKIVYLFGVETSLGNVLYGTTFLATDILNEKYGKKVARQSIYYCFSSMVAMTILMYLSLLYIPSSNDFANDSLVLIFTLNIRITLASITGYVISQFFDTWLYSKLREKYQALWIRKTGSTMSSQLIDTFLFTSIAYIGQLPLITVLSIGISTYLFKLFINILDTPIIYMAVKIKTKKE
ncbi:MAG: queuosine precursor transporter [Bacilli bacterium]|nr:queuosine precursor transporter [Bacilli bacterium]MDD4809447.1 queuosine precursor transporter [Bacilli bacterium]